MKFKFSVHSKATKFSGNFEESFRKFCKKKLAQNLISQEIFGNLGKNVW